MGDRRFEFRIITDDPVEVRWQESGDDKVREGQLCDRSPSGARIRLDRAIRVLSPDTPPYRRRSAQRNRSLLHALSKTQYILRNRIPNLTYNRGLPLSIRAVNTAADSENKIHDDAVAAEYGFRGGLVPGVTVYGYLASAALEHFGEKWLESGADELASPDTTGLRKMTKLI